MVGTIAAMSAFIVLALSSSLGAVNVVIRWPLSGFGEVAFKTSDNGAEGGGVGVTAVFAGANIIFLMFWNGVSKRSVSSTAVSTMKKYS